eukprot:COSAG02_NODE_6122_length_3784_cov_38.086024_4_plen_66_part_00
MRDGVAIFDNHSLREAMASLAVSRRNSEQISGLFRSSFQWVAFAGIIRYFSVRTAVSVSQSQTFV